jgi:hypothetical protein
LGVGASNVIKKGSVSGRKAKLKGGRMGILLQSGEMGTSFSSLTAIEPSSTFVVLQRLSLIKRSKVTN